MYIPVDSTNMYKCGLFYLAFKILGKSNGIYVWYRLGGKLEACTFCRKYKTGFLHLFVRETTPNISIKLD